MMLSCIASYDKENGITGIEYQGSNADFNKRSISLDVNITRQRDLGFHMG